MPDAPTRLVDIRPGAAKTLARDCNDYQARLVADHKGRLGMFTTLPLSDIDNTLAEIAYGMDVLKTQGVAARSSSSTHCKFQRFGAGWASGIDREQSAEQEPLHRYFSARAFCTSVVSWSGRNGAARNFSPTASCDSVSNPRIRSGSRLERG